MKGLIRRVGSGERGFTLIELLVVIAILGVIAAVVVLNIGGFIGRGQVESANTEAHQVQTAVIAAMTEGSDVAGIIVPGGAADEYLLNPETLQAVYTIGSDGAIASATYATGSKWDGLTYNAGTGWQESA